MEELSKTMKNLVQDNGSSGRDVKAGTQEIEAGALPTSSFSRSVRHLNVCNSGSSHGAFSLVIVWGHTNSPQHGSPTLLWQRATSVIGVWFVNRACKNSNNWYANLPEYL
jgi:hypothetical protein